MTRQEVFAKVCIHLMNQGKSATQGSQPDNPCRYRIKGLMCAAGCLIHAEHYKPALEGLSVIPTRGTEVADALLASGVHEADLEVVRALQVVHDSHNPDHWADRLGRVASRFNLMRPVCIRELDRPNNSY